MIKCFAATNSFWIDPQGHVRPCARFGEKFDHITEFQSFGEITQSEKHRNINDTLEKGQWPDSCVRCKSDEERGVFSKRSFYDRKHLHAPDDFMVDISMGNFCNLKCRMCGPQNSTSWNSDYKHLVDNQIIKPKNIDFAGYQLTDRDIEKLINHFRSVKGNIFIELKGGEPLIMPQTKKMVEHIISLDNVHKITLLIVTNATVFPGWLEQLSLKNKKIELVVSIDGIGDVFDYIRANEKFSYQDCIKNVERFSKLGNIDLHFNVVVQNLNIHQMLDVHLELTKFSRSINYIVLQFPDYLSANVMPISARKKIYQDFIDKQEQFGEYQNLMKNIHDILLTDPEAYLLKKFYRVMTSLDQLRNQDLYSVLPHFR